MNINIYKKIFLFLISLTFISELKSQHSVARQWNELLLQSIRKDFARPTVHARNLFHISAGMYDAWAVFDQNARPYFMGNTIGGFSFPFNGFTSGPDIEAQRNEAISFTTYRLLIQRFKFSPGFAVNKVLYDNFMASLGYDINNTSIDYSTGSAAALGNYIASKIIAFGLQDGSREAQSYTNSYYVPINPSLLVFNVVGNPALTDPNRWQPLTLTTFIDQSGNLIPGNTPPFLSAEWGNVVPFSFTNADKTTYTRSGNNYNVFLDPGPPEQIDTTSVAASAFYKRTYGLVVQWSAHLGANDGVTLDISPASIGNVQSLPNTLAEYESFYNFTDGGDNGTGRPLNPVTGLPYTPQIVTRADYSRVLAEFWADGPGSETPPGHWFTIVNYINDHPLFVKKHEGQGPIVGELEWDVKTYFTLGGAMHDAAISTWSIKGWYDNIRPISAIRYMAMKGQCTNPSLPHYHPAGMDLIPGEVELIQAGDPLQGPGGENINKIKVRAWKGHDFINTPNDQAGVDWILGEKWWPFQRPSFVTPPFAGYLSGHSTYSRAAAEVLTKLTGSEYFPGGMGEFLAPQNEFLAFEEGPSTDVTLQWASYRDASDQCSLSRIWGGIHPPMDDIPGRKNGIIIAEKAYNKAESYFFSDNDMDGYMDDLDCDDTNPNIHPGVTDVCDMIDNDCDGIIDGPVDFDGDGNADNCDNDDDNDAILDGSDDCPFTANNALIDSKGCTDNDQDGYYPDKDQNDPLFDKNDDDICNPLEDGDTCDPDEDGLTNLQERLGPDGIPDTGDESETHNFDTDGDGFTDGDEVLNMHTNPNDACSPYRPDAGCGTEVKGVVFNDFNYDGTNNQSEAKIAGITVSLYQRISNLLGSVDELIESTISDQNGTYNFNIIDEGNYYLRFTLEAEFGFTKANIGNDQFDSDVTEDVKKGSTDLFTVETGSNNFIFDAGLYQCNSIGSLVWYDVDKDDIADQNENGIDGIIVELYRLENGTFHFFDRTTTGHKPNTQSDDGYFNFCAPPGNYYVKVIMPPYGLVRARPNIGNNEAVDSDITNAFGEGTTNSFSIIAGNDKTDIGAGFYPMGVVGNLVWLDANYNGNQDSDEDVLANVLVEAYDEYFNLFASATTNQDGIYEIDYLEKQNYFLRFYPPDGLVASPANSNNDDENNDIDHSFGLNTTRLISIEPGDVLVNVDGGFAFAALPLIWKNFEGHSMADHNLLIWETESEINCKNFEIQRSIKGAKDFITIGSVKANNFSGDNKYSYRDYDKRDQELTSYRIRQNDFDGKYTISKTIDLISNNGITADFKVYPNPAKSKINVDISDIIKRSNQVEIAIFNSTGQKIFEKTTSSGFEIIENLQPNLYSITISAKGQLYTKRIMVIE